MTISNTYQQGDLEPFSETIRALIARGWESNVTPKILSDFGHADNPANLDAPLRPNDFNLKDDEPAVILKEGGTLTNNFDNNFTELETTVFINIYGDTKSQLIIKEEVDRIIFESQPNSSSRIKKSDNSNDSPIINIKQNVIGWQKIGSIAELGVIEQLAGQIECIWEKQKT